jgi:hypothetical protein
MERDSTRIFPGGGKDNPGVIGNGTAAFMTRRDSP